VPSLAAGLLALVALLLLPGLLVVRAPWTAVPALSLAFWALSAWWPLAGRGRFLLAAVPAFGLLSFLRLLPKHQVPPPLGWSPPPAPPPPACPGLPPPRLASAPSLLVLAASVAVLAPALLWHHAPGPRLAFQTTTARLLLWRDGIPSTAEPLLPLAPVGAHAPAIATLAADVSHVSGADPAASVLLVVVAAAGLLLLGLFALHATWAPPRVAVLGALVGLAAAPWPGALSPWGEGEALLALGLALPAVALLLGHASRSSAMAAGMLLAGSALAHPLLAAVTAALVAGAVLARPSSGGRRPGRLVLSMIVALALAAPGLWPLARALSPAEAAAIALSVEPTELPAAVLGLVLVAFAPFLFLRLAEPGSRRRRLATAALAVVGTTLLVARVHGWIASAQLPDPVRAALLRVAAETDPLETVCAPEGTRDWIPALAEREAGEPGPWVPAVYAEAWARRSRHRCGTRLEAFVSPP
jgi:hypothetical protein